MNCSLICKLSTVAILGLGCFVIQAGCSKKDSGGNAGGTPSTRPNGSTSTAGNLRQIYFAMTLYAQECNDLCPYDLGWLAKTENLKMDVFVSPEKTGNVPSNSATMSPDDIAAWVNAHTDYGYLGAHQSWGQNPTPDSSPRPIVYEKEPKNGQITVLFRDSHIEAMPEAQAKQLINQNK